MTKYEKVTTLLSAVAITLATANPFIVYKWLNPPLQEIQQEFKQRGRLQVSSSTDSREYQMQVIRKIIMEGGDGSEVVPIVFDVEIVNVGELPAKNVQVVAQYSVNAPEKPSLILEPPSHYDVVTRNDQLFLTIKKSVAPRDRLKISFKDYPSRVSISNEYGETSTIDTDLGWFHRSEELRQELRKEFGKPSPTPQ